MVDVLGTDEFDAWFQALSDAEAREVMNVVDKLEILGLSLGFPHSSAVAGGRHALRELRPKRGKSPIRVFYAFDPQRQAVVLIGGDKSGDNKFYERLVPVAERIFEEYLTERAAERPKQ